MKYFHKLDVRVDPAAALAELERHPELWGADTDRTAIPDSPHAQAPDIWLRCRPRREIDTPARFGEPHFSEFYPAWHKLPALHPLVFGVMFRCHAAMLGFTMLSLIRPGCAVKPHVDKGWHADFYTRKVYVILAANDRCINRCGDEAVIMQPGSVWQFENRVPHSVENRGDTDRVALIVTMRTE